MRDKKKKVGICYRVIDVDGEVGNLEVTEGAIRGGIRSALRHLWRTTTRRVFLEKIRYKVDKRFFVDCVLCPRVMGLSEKAKVRLKSGEMSKKEKSVYQIDHTYGCHPFLKFEDLGKFAHDLFYGEMRVLCYRCHTKHTEEQGRKS